MHPLRFIVPTLSLAAVLSAEPSAPDETHLSNPETAQGIAVENLLSERRSPETFETAITHARKSGVSEQAILEARFLFHVDRNEDGKVADMAPQLLKQRESFKPEDTVAFATREDWLAVVEYAQALDSLRKGDKPNFKTHITEAFWLSPQLGGAFAPLIERVRLAEAMRTVKIDFSIRLNPIQADQDSVTLTDIATNKKALLLHFWSPESAECADSMPDFTATASTLTAADIAVVSLSPAGTPENLTKAIEITRTYHARSNGRWLLDSLKKPLSRTLRVKTVPVVALISIEGSVLFNGSPSDPKFWSALENIDPEIKRPDSPDRDVGIEE